MVCSSLMLNPLTWKLKHSCAAWPARHMRRIVVSSLAILCLFWLENEENKVETHEITHQLTVVDIYTVLAMSESLSGMERKDSVGSLEEATITAQNGTACWVSLAISSADAAAFQAVYSQVFSAVWLQIAARVACLPFPNLTAVPYCQEFS